MAILAAGRDDAVLAEIQRECSTGQLAFNLIAFALTGFSKMNTQSNSRTRSKVIFVFVAIVAMAVVITGWARDRNSLNAKIQEFDYSIGKQSLSDYFAPLEISYYESQTEGTKTCIALEDLASCPTWDATGNPPISAREAIALADAAASKLSIYGESKWEFQDVSLSQLEGGETVNGSYWCWRASYRGHDSMPSFRTGEIWVLFDGSVVTPKVVQK